MNKQITLLISFLAIPGLTMAQEEGQNMFEQYQLEIVVGFALLVCLVIAALFVKTMLGLEINWVVGALFTFSTLALVVGLAYFLREVHLATKTVRIALPKSVSKNSQ